MRVISVTWSFPEPSEPFILEKLLGLTARGVECVVVAPKLAAAPTAIRTRRPPRDDSRRELAVAAMAAARRDRAGTRRALAIQSPSDRARALPLVDPLADIIHFESAGFALAHRRLLPHLRAKTVVTCQGSDVRIDPYRSPEIRDGLAEVFTMVDRIHCVSAELADQCLRLGARPDQLLIASRGTDLRTFRPIPRSARPGGFALRIASVGRLAWVKGYDYALTAIRELRNEGISVHYTIVGVNEGQELAIRLAIHEFGLEDVVTLTGHLSRDGVRDVFARSDIFLLSSLSEGSSVATMDAMAMGLPVVVTDVGGARELVEDGVHGFVVPSRDPIALAGAVKQLRPFETRHTMGARGAERARDEFDSQVQIGRLLAMYQELVADTATGSHTRGDLVSVVIVARNAGATIEDQLRALSFQQYGGEWEVIVVDNRSDDDTRTRAEAWKARLPTLRVVDASARTNIAYARNVGARAALGTRVLMCDADDVVAPGWLAALAAALTHDPLVIGALERSLLLPAKLGSEARVDTEPPIGEDYRLKVVTSNVGFRREVFDAVGGFDESLRRGSDMDFGWRAMDAGFAPRFVADAVVHFRSRWRPSAVMRQGFADGRTTPAIYLRHRGAGMPRPTPRTVAARYAALVRTIPTVVSPRRRPDWFYDTAQCAGRIIGSLENRVPYL